MKPFGHGGDIYAFAHPVLDFSASLNPLGLPEGVRKAIRSVADAPCHYPDPFCRELVGEIAQCERCCGFHLPIGVGGQTGTGTFIIAMLFGI